MGVKDIRSELDKIFRIVAGWQGADPVSDIERELVLDKLKRVYEEVMFFDRETVPAETEHGVAGCATSPDTQAVRNDGGTGVDAQKPADAEPVSEKAARQPGPVAGTGESVASEEAPAAEQQLFDDAEVRRPAGNRRQVILSLYGDEACATRPAEPKSPVQGRPEVTCEQGEPAGAEQHKRVLGEVIGGTTTSVCDDFARHNARTDLASKLQASQVAELRKALGVNDRFLMIRDLFAGDAAACEAAIAQLDSFADLDDALIYIQETYAWNPDSEAARLVVDLLTRKLG